MHIIRKFLFSALFIGSVLALIRWLFSKTAGPMPVSAEPNSQDPPFDAIDAYVEEQRRRLHIPGASLAIVEGERIVHQRGFGRACPAGDAPTPQTPFFIGSLTKSITALAVMQLVEAGKVELDAAVQHYLPWFRLADPQASAQMTVRHLLNQTSGLPYFPSAAALADFDESPGTIERQVRALSALKIKSPVGTKFAYSNLNFNILGLIVETISGEPYSNFVQKHIFDPLEMHHSHSTTADAKRDGLAVGHRHWFSLPFPEPDIPIPAGSLPSGQLISCAEDMAHYLIAHLNGGRYGDLQILSEAGIAELQRGAAEWRAMGMLVGYYGMGWVSQEIGKVRVVSHSGNVPNFSAFMGLVPEQKRGVILLLNADPYGLPAITEEIGMGLTALLAGEQPAPIKLDFIQWIMRLLPLILLLQVVGVFATLRVLRRWEREPAIRPGGGRLWGQHILLPLFPNLTLAGILVYMRSTGVIYFVDLFMPDLAWIARISGGFALVWSLMRTGLILRSLLGSSAPGTSVERSRSRR
jgi:CubicO group peptidase (beta-lactamase class C family)